MLTVEQVNCGDKRQVGRFVRFPFRLYADNPYWVPPILLDVENALNRQKHPFYEHSEAAFFMAMRNGQVVGRIAAVENRRFNEYHGTRQAQFCYFDADEDQEIAAALFNRVFEWAHERGLDQIVGPKGLGPLDGYGMLQDGFDKRQVMTMSAYNHPYYVTMIEALGFRKEVDFITCYLNPQRFQLPERVHRIAARVLQRGTLKVHRFSSKRELRAWAPRIGKAYNEAFVDNWEYYPLTENEVKFVVDNILQVAIPRLIKVITAGDRMVGFLFAFPDVSTALQRARGRLLPFGLIHLLLDLQRTKWVALNGVGILPEFQGRGGNALLYSEMDKTIREAGYQHAVLVQVAETAVQMRRDLENLGAEPYNNHRVYIKDI